MDIEGYFIKEKFTTDSKLIVFINEIQYKMYSIS